MSDPHRMLTRLLRAYLDSHGLDPQLSASHSRDWASATFSGARHHFMFALDDDGAELRRRLAQAGAAIPEADIMLPGHIVADISLAADAEGRAFTIEALTVEAA